jgi:hypothetical protein
LNAALSAAQTTASATTNAGPDAIWGDASRCAVTHAVPTQATSTAMRRARNDRDHRRLPPVPPSWDDPRRSGLGSSRPMIPGSAPPPVSLASIRGVRWITIQRVRVETVPDVVGGDTIRCPWNLTSSSVEGPSLYAC